MSDHARGESVDGDPEYETDAAADVDAEAAEFEPADPAEVPEDEGDAGHADVPGGGG